MFKRAFFTLLTVIPSAASLAATVTLTEADQAAVRKAATDYAQGWYTGDRDRMASSLHDSLAKRAYLPDKTGKRSLNQMDKATLLAGNRPENAAKYANAPKRTDIEILDGFGNAATVRLQMDGWVDYMHVVRSETGEWRIINVLWELTPK
ncbi:nuclear transport factor 2 family protein [Tahibacter amnicola]|uniref:Nuclear transport factor 2 family protein n=1 Tax=Tahibacter amnicola TaxID=2976241 RepID=A0ABY6BB20_9GAMM|nr:nuclear transport factor 2 family protein [Tahibacter amnicola]UXI67248.1 nuclear transport factor 2 family protein [Tahibacter amnicola]